MAGGFLLDGDGRREALDHVHIGLVQPPQELAGVSGEAFHITPLAFGVQRVERQRGFARAGHAGDDDELVARDIEIDVFQVVGARATDADAVVPMRRCANCGRGGGIGGGTHPSAGKRKMQPGMIARVPGQGPGLRGARHGVRDCP